uniref:B30.2/SPRY domain-containing protein n=1 Tax=Sander lucioperca TaxID=283035 RepID=A0A8C9Z3D3_SANLU
LTPGENWVGLVVCDKHPQVPYLFCKDEDRVVCTVCEFSLHHGYTVVPVEQAVRDLKEQLKSDLQSLQDKRDKHRRVKKTYDEINQHSKKQLLSTESQIRAEFNKLHQFLKEEEESRLAALREEEKQREKTVSREVKRIQEQISSLSDSISAVEADLKKDRVPFLSSYKASQSRARVQCSLSDPQLLSGALTDVAKHLGNLSFRIMNNLRLYCVLFFPSDVCELELDTNTLHRRLKLSKNSRMVTYVREEYQSHADHPDRFDWWPQLLCRDGLTGRCYWEVVWRGRVHISVSYRGIRRRGDSKECVFGGNDHSWSLVCADDNGYSVYHSDRETSIPSPSSSSSSPSSVSHRVAVYVDCPAGTLSFYRVSSDSLIHLHTFNTTFTDPLYPGFGFWVFEPFFVWPLT